MLSSNAKLPIPGGLFQGLGVGGGQDDDTRENALLTATGPGTPGGELMRRYWHPIALSSELPPGGAATDPAPQRTLALFR